MSEIAAPGTGQAPRTAGPVSRTRGGRPLFRRLAVAAHVAQVHPPQAGHRGRGGCWRCSTCSPPSASSSPPTTSSSTTRNSCSCGRSRSASATKTAGGCARSCTTCRRWWTARRSAACTRRTRRTRHYLRFFVHGDPYKLWGIWEADLRLVGVRGGRILPVRHPTSWAATCTRAPSTPGRISLSIGLVGVFLSFVLGCTMGGISGYYGGKPDMVIQRGIEILISLPTIPLWMALSAALPTHWGTLKTYFAITIILSMFGWAGLARVVRGKLLELRPTSRDFVDRGAGGRQRRGQDRRPAPAAVVHELPDREPDPGGALHDPGREPRLSFLGLGLRPPVVSWGTLLQDAQNVHAVLLHPWLLIPGLFVVVAVLAFKLPRRRPPRRRRPLQVARTGARVRGCGRAGAISRYWGW